MELSFTPAPPPDIVPDHNPQQGWSSDGTIGYSPPPSEPDQEPNSSSECSCDEMQEEAAFSPEAEAFADMVA